MPKGFQPGNQYGRNRNLVTLINEPPPAPVIAAALAAEAPPTPPPLPDLDFGPIKRLARSDVAMVAFAMERMRRTWPRLNDNALYNRLHSAMDSNEFMIAAHAAGVGMAHVWREPIEGHVWIRQIFLYIPMPEAGTKRLRVSAAMHIVRFIERWGRTMNATRYEIDGGSDLDPAELVETMKAEYHDTVFRDLTKLGPL
jgi:hypothetical protein